MAREQGLRYRMKAIRQALMWLTLLLTLVLAVLSVYSTFLGQQRSIALFNSIPLVAYWATFLAVLGLGLAFFPRLLRSPGRLAVHLGTMLVLIGAMMGSEKGHEIARRLGLHHKAPMGYMILLPGEQSNTLTDAHGHPLMELPFTVQLERFWVERYEPKDTRWALAVEVARGEVQTDAQGREQPCLDTRRIDWEQAGDALLDIPCTTARLRVLAYLPHARPVRYLGRGGRGEDDLQVP